MRASRQNCAHQHIDSDPLTRYKIVNLHFSDGTVVRVIDEHAFWNVNLNKYVYLRDDGAKYIGDMFNKQAIASNGNLTWTNVKLVDVVITNEVTTAWSPVTAEHLCYYVNGMLSMPGGIESFLNIFEVDPDTMMYDKVKMQNDIDTYGLFTYEEFNAIVNVPVEIFYAFDCSSFKVAIGKGLMTEQGLIKLVDSYKEFWT